MNRLLVVDDEPNNLKAIRRIFQDQPYELAFAANGPEAFEIAEKFRPDVVVLDIMMPGMDGYDVCRRLKKIAAAEPIMVLLLSARSSLEDRLKGYDAAADDYLTKPYAPEELLAKVLILVRLKDALTELQATNQNLERLVIHRTHELIRKDQQAMVGQLVHGIIHNLQNPMMVVSGFSGLSREIVARLQQSPPKTEACELLATLARNLDQITLAQERLEAIIQNLMSRGRSDRLDIKTSINFNELLQKELGFLEADMNFKHAISKNLELDPELPDCLGIYSDFAQVCHNLIRNGVDAMRHSPQKQLTIITRHDHQDIFIEFRDTGPGIDPDLQERIFDPFFTTKPAREDAGETDEPCGTGLGLHSCKQLLAEYGGDVSVQSHPGHGAHFTVRIPRRRE